MRAALLSTLLAGTAAGCFFPSLDGLGGASLDAGEGGADVGDAGDAGDSGPSGPVTLASVGAVPTETGNAQQTHVVWAAGAKRWWLFYIDNDSAHLKTRSSPDFATWTDGPSLGLPNPSGGDGRDFSVAYAFVGGADVVHVSFSEVGASALSHSHTRGVITGASIAFEAPLEIGTPVPASVAGPDGPATLVASDGSVWDSTGFAVSDNSTSGHYNEDVFAGSAPETGAATWGASFLHTTIEVVPQASNARAMIDVGVPVAIWEDGIDEPNPTNLHYASYAGGWSSPASTFTTDATQDPNDWGAAALHVGATIEGHVLRARLAGGYDHVSGSSGPIAAAAPPTLARQTGAGVVLLSDPTHLAAFDLASDGSVQRSRWDGAQWSAWEPLAPAGARAFLSGFCPDLDAHPEAGGCALVWTAPGNGGYVVEGLLAPVAP